MWQVLTYSFQALRYRNNYISSHQNGMNVRVCGPQCNIPAISNRMFMYFMKSWDCVASFTYSLLFNWLYIKFHNFQSIYFGGTFLHIKPKIAEFPRLCAHSHQTLSGAKNVPPLPTWLRDKRPDGDVQTDLLLQSRKYTCLFCFKYDIWGTILFGSDTVHCLYRDDIRCLHIKIRLVPFMYIYM